MASSIDGAPSTLLASAPKRFVFKPTDDITVSELAAILGQLLEVQEAAFIQPMYNNLPDACKRHFTLDSVSATKAYLTVLGSGSINQP